MGGAGQSVPLVEGQVMLDRGGVRATLVDPIAIVGRPGVVVGVVSARKNMRG